MSLLRLSGSIFWGLVLLVVGSVVLLRNLGYAIPLWTMFFRYWPVLLIVWGLFKLVDYLRMEPGGQRRPLFSAGDVTAIIFVILFGSLATMAANLSPKLGDMLQIGNFDIWNITGNAFTFTEHHSVDAKPDSTVEISNRFGDVEVSPSDGDRIEVDVSKSVRAQDQGAAEKLSSGFVYSITNEGSKFRIGSSLDRRFRVSLTVKVPRRATVSVENRNGSVRIQGLTGKQTVANRFGAVEVHGITGAVQIENQNGKVNVNDISDAVNIKNTFGEILVANVRGELKINGRNNSIDVDHVEKDLDVDASFQNIDLRDARGKIDVKNRNGEISIRLLQKPMHDISVSSEFGNVTVEVPDGSSFKADLHTRFGNVNSDFFDGQNCKNMVCGSSGQVGTGGPNIQIDNRNGQINLRRKG